tara:strand:- start:1233 stop:1976 length:744 start_codon:yes stop_codon:yes gene_type:complete
MRETLELIIGLSKILELSTSQTLFILARKNGVNDMEISSDDLEDLIGRAYINGERISPNCRADLAKATIAYERGLVEIMTENDVDPKLTYESAQIVKQLSTAFLADRCTGKEVDRLLAYEKNLKAIPYLFMFLQMFPTSDSNKNKPWDKTYGTTWTNVTLRRMTKGTARKFKAIWKSKDIGLFLLGTHIFIQQSYNSDSDTYFIKKIENYMDEWENWYNEAEDRVNSGVYAEFTKNQNIKHTNTYAI